MAKQYHQQTGHHNHPRHRLDVVIIPYIFVVNENIAEYCVIKKSPVYDCI